jgi:recombination protein RecR
MDRLIQSLSRLPGVGKRSAERMAFHLLKQPPQESEELADAILELKRAARHCSTCYNLTPTDPCSICSDPKRDHSLILVVEQPGDLATFENTGMYRGAYHVLMGRLSPLDGVGPGELNIDSLIHRVNRHHNHNHNHNNHDPTQPHPTPIKEVILGTQPTLEGDGTALYLTDRLNRLSVKVTRLARGIPVGATLDIVSKAVLSDALQGRQPAP